jgi:hypothetical protein
LDRDYDQAEDVEQHLPSAEFLPKECLPLFGRSTLVDIMFVHIVLIWRAAFLPHCSTTFASLNGHLNRIT